MGPIYLVTERPLGELLHKTPRDYSANFERVDLQKFRNDPLTGEENGVLVLDLSVCSESGKLIQPEVVRNHPAVIILVQPDHVDRIQDLINEGIQFFLREPIGCEELRQSLEALRKDRRYMDPSLSDALVERYLS